MSLALQGGGAHGAFTWGVLDRLLEDERVVIDGISGTSAGAMNGAALAYGMIRGGREGARELLSRFWNEIGRSARWSPFQPTWFDNWWGTGSLDLSPAYFAFDMWSRLFSPYQFNPFDYNPLRTVLGNLIDFEELRRSQGVKLFASATNVRTGKIKVFGLHEISADAILASACLPMLFRAVEIEGEHYWDGGYMGNPAIFPLLYECEASDVVIVEVNPIRTERVPETAREILDRMNNISFNSTLMREMRAIAFVSELVDDHLLSGNNRLRKINFHMIEAERMMDSLGASSKFNASLSFLHSLRDLGRERAEEWLAHSFAKVGAESSIDLQHLFF
ncbi:MAG: patatin-like phospholipase family protein [Alphaproteobacteria bacterium]